MSDESVTHTQYARSVDVPVDLLRHLLDDGTLPSEGKRGPQYTVDPAAMPDGPGIVAACRVQYRRSLSEAIGAVRRLETEIESVRLDLTDALENGTDPVDVLGADVTSVNALRGPSQLALSDLRFAVMTVEALHGSLFDHDRGRRLMREN